MNHSRDEPLLSSPPSDAPLPLPPPPDPLDSRLYTPHRWPFTNLPRHISYPLLSTYFFLAIAQSLPTTAISFLLIYSLSLSPALLNSTYTLWFQAGVTRPLWGLLSDHVPLFGSRRRSYLLLSALLCCVFTLLMASTSVSSSPSSFIALGFLVYLFWATAEAMTDSVVVELGNEQVVHAIHRLHLTERSRTEQRERRREYGVETDEDRRGGGEPAPRPSAARTSAFAKYESPVDVVTQRVKARLQSECMAVRTVGTIVAYALSIGLLRVAEREWREVVAFNAVSFLPAMIAACFIQERGVKEMYGLTAVTAEGTIPLAADTDSEEDADEDSSSSSSSSAAAPAAHSDSDAPPPEAELPPNRRQFFRAKLVQLYASLKLALYPLLFLFFYYAVPSSSDTYYYFLYGGSFSFEAWQADLFSFISLLGSLSGTLFYSRYLSATPIARLFLLTVALSTAAESLRFLLVFNRTDAIGLPPSLYIPLTSTISAFIGGIRNMLPIVLAHQHAPRRLGMEGSMFSLFQVADRLGVLVSGGLAAWMTEALGIERGEWGRLWVLMLLCMTLEWLPLLLVPFMLRRRPPPDVEIAMEKLGGVRRRRSSEAREEQAHA